MNRSLTSFIALLFAFVIMTGCGEKLPSGMPKLFPASITVTQEGEPLDGAMVLLIPEDSALQEWGPGGLTNASGVAVMRTNGKCKGAPLGKYKVTVTKTEREPHPHPEWADLPMNDPNYRQFLRMAESLKAYNLVERDFGSRDRTPLQVEVASGQKSHSVDVGNKIRNEIGKGP